ncbi:aminodeoxychorismate synthase, component I [Bordetella genomosp. 9]|uniref:Aminodeoxychorismate synthase, component I n=1 Tax=Bordetella genomosp. 9 TaxID=1416803 RepID=A0A261RQN7_9BORD|nr:aminodeoxychorismate synthase component I [Bordetella genomosp. 9]OZI26603.1 aminodeoxychorismate synthase, component I [Bordetella genomosp. 9]
MFCRFEDRLAGRALQLEGPRDRIEACAPDQVQAALDAMEAARAAGRWVALLLDFELGEWLLPPPAGTASGITGRPRLRALVFDQARQETPWAAAAPPAGSAGAIAAIAARQDRASYLDRIAAIRDGIGRGDYYQVNYTMPLDVRVRGDRRALYRRIAARNPVAHAAFIEDGGQSVLSFSPELFVQRRGDLLTTRPMKGTAPRDADPARDHALGQALLASDKNRAENLMIVDLLRNDLGRIAETGSVRADPLFTLERYPTVWTMTSTVTARAPRAGLGDVLRALFPCGSVTGAPKVAALAHIRQAEIAPRGLYCGSLGWLAPDGDFSLNVAIRTLVVDADGRGVYGVGGGIVHDSEPDSEWQECLWKARILDQELDPA